MGKQDKLLVPSPAAPVSHSTRRERQGTQGRGSKENQEFGRDGAKDTRLEDGERAATGQTVSRRMATRRQDGPGWSLGLGGTAGDQPLRPRRLCLD